MGQHQRQPWFGCACCPSNICRFIPSLPGYIYAVSGKDIFINVFVSNSAELKVNNKNLVISQQTQYPWNGDIKIKIDKTNAGPFNMNIRIPGWVQNEVVPGNLYTYSDGKRLNYTVTVNGEPVDSQTSIKKGYISLNRKWVKGDNVEVHFDMETRTVKANSKVEADRGRIAIERGPLVYCAEWADNDFDILNIIINQTPKFEIENKPDLLYGINRIKTDAQILKYNDNGELVTKSEKLTLIPYYSWAHRGSGNMAVWLPQELLACKPTMQPTISSKSKIEASHPASSISSINDRLLPNSDNDRLIPYYHWWPKQGSTEWIVYDIPESSTISQSSVYWYDDAPWGGCRVPLSWKIYYKDNDDNWQPVSNPSKYGIEKGTANTVYFDPVTTNAIKLEVLLPEENASGLYEWEIH